MTRPYNFAPGPAMLPESVLKQIQSEMLDFHGCGWSILEASHRGPQVTGVMTELKSRLRQLLSIPDTYDVLFCPGGGRMQFAMVPMNLLGAGTLSTYIITGAWSKAAAKEALRFGRVQSAFSGSGNRIPADEELEVIPETSYCAYCDNETIHGIEFERVPVLKDAEAVPLVAVMTSNFLTLNYSVYSRTDSVPNTPPVFQLYVANLMAQWIEAHGGVAVMDEYARARAKIVYDAIDAMPEMYVSHVERESRSRVNAVFRLKDEALTALFVKEAAEAGLANLAGHRAVGGIRASMYNAMPIEGVQKLADFMKTFAHRHGRTQLAVN